MPPRRIPLSALPLCCLLALPCVSEARIGDTPRQMDSRILQPDVGKYYSLRGLSEREQNQMRKDMPTASFAPLLPSDIREVVYWKSALRRHLSNDDGWRVHVFYWKDRSVLEAYRRVGDSLSEFEINALLNMNRSGQTWTKVEKPKDKPKDQAAEPADTVIGYDYELGADGLRAKVQGNWLVIYLTRFDKLLVDRKKEQDALDAEEAARRRSEQQQRAPESVEGF